jgi:hypothetical protein
MTTSWNWSNDKNADNNPLHRSREPRGFEINVVRRGPVNGVVRRTRRLRSAAILPDPQTLRVGDRIRILRVPDADLRQRENEIDKGAEMAGWTADSIERIIAHAPIVQISHVDEYGCVWYETSIIGPDGTEELHSLIVYDDDTWEPVQMQNTDARHP